MAGAIDCDVHPYMPDGVGAIFPYLSEGWRRRLEPYKGVYATRGRREGKIRPAQEGLRVVRGPSPWGGSRKDEIPPSGDLPGSDPQFMIERYLGRHDVEAALLLPTQPLVVGSFVNADEATVVASAFNDCFIEHWLSQDQRFRLAIVVSPHDPPAAAKEIRRLGGTPGVAGVMMPLLNVLMGERLYHPVYEAAAEVGLPLILHLHGAEGDFVGNPVYAGGTPGGHIEKYSMFAELAISHSVSLIFQGTFERFPQLKVIFTEFGWSWVPHLLWRMDAAWKAGRRSVPWVQRAPSEYFQDHIRVTTQPALEIPTQAYLQQILDMMVAKRTLLFSTDYPHWDSDEPEFIFRNIPEDLKMRIFRENAVETFGDRILTPGLGLAREAVPTPS